jgi:hypothetical protein
MEFTDVTGTPRRDEEIERVLALIRVRFLSLKFMTQDPELFVEFPTIKDALDELLRRRKSDSRGTTNERPVDLDLGSGI